MTKPPAKKPTRARKKPAAKDDAENKPKAKREPRGLRAGPPIRHSAVPTLSEKANVGGKHKKKDPKKLWKPKVGTSTHGDKYTQDLGDEICRRIEEGMTLRKVCEMEDMPERTVVIGWANKRPFFRNQLTRSRVECMISWADDIVEAADESVSDYKLTLDLDDPRVNRIEEDGKVTFTFSGDHLNRSKLKIETRRWLMERINSEQFGIRQYIDITQRFFESTDDEIIAELREVFNRSGIPIERLVEMLTKESEEKETRH